MTLMMTFMTEVERREGEALAAEVKGEVWWMRERRERKREQRT